MQRLIVLLKKIEIFKARWPESDVKYVPNNRTPFCRATSTMGGPKSSQPFRRLDYVPKSTLVAFIFYPSQTLYTAMLRSIQSVFKKKKKEEKKKKKEDKEQTPLSGLGLQDYER
jgi:hypothetical protein